MMVPTIIWAALYGDALHWTYAVLCLLWIVIMALLARAFGGILVTSLCLQFENLALANDARLQKENAEEANKAKSRFLAAASHDLRQPVHALEMFVGALRLQNMAPESSQLVGQIQNSVDSLEGLFNSILDVSRLDAGLVEVRARSFAIAPLIERICADERAAAAGRDIELRLVPCSAIVRTDPVLLERVLRNLVSNAVRHTERGRVLVGCRPRGRRLSIEVKDTGPGIVESERELIFQEFYQIANPERDRKQGLGLGLAIVRRLCGVLKTPLSFDTAPGKGSTFRVSVPVTTDAPLSQPAHVLEQNEHGQNKLFIAVIDDEPEIQSAMFALLTAWGHVALVAGSGAEAMSKIGARSPDLVISDHRLRGGENGFDVVSRLRAQFQNEIPAILITGDTAPDRLREAVASGCFLMHKPISNARLRAAIINLTKVEN
ncbi:MAG TPA: hybrid sensor histidine kinase/response regulator [Pseudolabrys sp.]